MAKGNNVHITRVFNAPRELVFQAWTDPESMKRWYAPKDCTFSVKKMDLRQGGTFLTCISNPQFGDCWVFGKYLELKSPERIVYTMTNTDENGKEVDPKSLGMDPEWPGTTTVTLSFSESNGRTTMTLDQDVSETVAKRTGAHPSWLQMFDHLDQELDENERGITITRTFDAPVNLVWEAITNSEHADKWWGPNGFRNETLSKDFRVGGSWRYLMHGPDKVWPNRQTYTLIQKNKKLAYDHGSDIDNDPDMFKVTMTFEEVAGKTQLTMRMILKSVEALEAVKKFGAIEGGKQTLNRLAEYLQEWKAKA